MWCGRAARGWGGLFWRFGEVRVANLVEMDDGHDVRRAGRDDDNLSSF